MRHIFFIQAEDGIRDLVRSRGLGDVYKRQFVCKLAVGRAVDDAFRDIREGHHLRRVEHAQVEACLLYPSDAADERSSVDLGGRRII